MKRHLAATLLLVVLTGCASSGGEDTATTAISEEAQAAEARRIAENEAARKAEEAAQAEAAASAAAEAALPPDPADFRIEVIVLEKECFGSAGCNVTFRIDPKYTGTRDVEDVEVTYEVLGGEDGPKINTFTIDSAGMASFDEEEHLSTPSSNTEITAKVTSVRRAP
jgi:hypothetical protein